MTRFLGLGAKPALTGRLILPVSCRSVFRIYWNLNGMEFKISTLRLSKVNLPNRYRAHNLILSGMPPGPTEPNADQLQHFLKLIVDALLELYDNGILITTPEYPAGKLNSRWSIYS